MYEVGQILYTVIEKHRKIIPLKVIEQVVKKTLDGETVEYTVKIPTNKTSQKTYSLSKFRIIFKSIKEVEDYLEKNAKKAISIMIEEVMSLERNSFDEQTKESDNKISLDDQSCNNENNDVIIDLGNGQKGKISISNLENISQKKT